MERKELISSMKQFTGCGFITRKELADYMGFKDPHSVDSYIYGLPSTKKKYFINDVATMIQAAMN